MNDGQTEGGRCINGLLFTDTPWVYWDAASRVASCERCGQNTEVWQQTSDETQLSDTLLSFWRAHLECQHGDEVVEQRPSVSEKEATAAPASKEAGGKVKTKTHVVIFPPNNRIRYTYVSGVDIYGHPEQESAVGIPHGIPFEVRMVDAQGAWLYGPGFGGRPAGRGPIRVPWTADGA